MRTLLSVFDVPVIPGFRTRSDIVSASEEGALVEHIEAEDLSPFRFQQWTGKRLTRSFGWSYDFESGHFAQTEPLPAWLDDLRMRAAAFAVLSPENLVQALLTRYDPGAGIGIPPRHSPSSVAGHPTSWRSNHASLTR